MNSTIVMGGTLRSDWKNEATSENKKKRERKRGGVSRAIVSVEMNFSFRAKVAKRFVT